MNRPVRILLNVFMPPLLAAGCFVVVILLALAHDLLLKDAAASRSWERAFDASLLVIYFSYIIAILPSLLHAGLMELAYRRFPASSWSAVTVSAASGTLAGTLITAYFACFLRTTHTITPPLLIYIGLGAFVGFLIGLFIKLLSRSPSSRSHHAMRGCE